MNREILFRGKRVDNGEWIDGYYCPKPYSHFPCEDTIFPIETLNQCWQGVKIIPGTLSQYTGLTDKNGRKIFEGDIVRCEDEILCEDIGDMAVENNGFAFTLREPGSPPDLIDEADAEWCNEKFEVVGNIYDDPELMGGDNNA